MMMMLYMFRFLCISASFSVFLWHLVGRLWGMRSKANGHISMNVSINITLYVLAMVSELVAEFRVNRVLFFRSLYVHAYGHRK